MAFNTEVRFSDYGGASDPGIQEERPGKGGSRGSPAAFSWPLYAVLPETHMALFSLCCPFSHQQCRQEACGARRERGLSCRHWAVCAVQQSWPSRRSGSRWGS